MSWPDQRHHYQLSKSFVWRCGPSWKLNQTHASVPPLLLSTSKHSNKITTVPIQNDSNCKYLILNLSLTYIAEYVFDILRNLHQNIPLIPSLVFYNLCESELCTSWETVKEQWMEVGHGEVFARKWDSLWIMQCLSQWKTCSPGIEVYIQWGITRTVSGERREVMIEHQ